MAVPLAGPIRDLPVGRRPFGAGPTLRSGEGRAGLGLEDGDQVPRPDEGLVLLPLVRGDGAGRVPLGEVVEPGLGGRVRPEAGDLGGNVRGKALPDRVEEAVQGSDFDRLVQGSRIPQSP